MDYRDLEGLDPPGLDLLAKEIREMIIKTVESNGGHLASSLGAVELNIALLRSFDPSKDRIIFDVGHQAYAYKILTGRKDRFKTLRKWKGISGFPDPKESPFDHFNAGHSSKSLSAALGQAKARDLLGQDHHVVAVIGDGSLINGLALEALNHVNELDTPVIFILNDNQMSISKRVGGMASHLAALSVNPMYRQFKRFLKYFCHRVPEGKKLESLLERSKQTLKRFLLPPNIFEDLGISYWGPFDGHDIQEMEKIFSMAKGYGYPLLVHLLTTKGKGFKPAEEDSEKFHGISPCPSALTSGKPSPGSWSEASAACIEELAGLDPRVVLLTAAMKEGSKLGPFQKKYPERFFDVGIAEGHLLTFAAGMATAGLLPVVSIYSTFLQRAMDQLVHDICMQDLHVILAIDRAGLVGEDGETDVYKRQEARISEDRLFIENALLDLCDKNPPGIPQRLWDSMTYSLLAGGKRTVSYTHLDVYKRQDQWSEGASRRSPPGGRHEPDTAERYRLGQSAPAPVKDRFHQGGEADRYPGTGGYRGTPGRIKTEGHPR